MRIQIAQVIFFFLCLSSLGRGEADVGALTWFKEGPVHEAYIVPEAGQEILQARPTPPPEPLIEVAPSDKNPQAVWVEGYWEWKESLQDYIWVSGMWRLPPPGHQWIAGYWKNYPQGWVRIPGFWSVQTLGSLEYIPQVPPTPLDERVSTPPPPSDAHFWVPGYWHYLPDQKEFVWFSGRWELLTKEWIYTPAHYIWREKGFVCVEGFWDWDLEARGTPYMSVWVEPRSRASFTFPVQHETHSLVVVEALFPSWPDYRTLYAHHYYFHFDLWVSWGAAPPWWNWETWGAFSHHDTWALWWWWSHPGYPQPAWLTPALAAVIPPPTVQVKEILHSILSPSLVTPRGVLSTASLLEMLYAVSGMPLPILPTDPEQVLRIQLAALKHPVSPPYLLPQGKPGGEAPHKPFFGPSLMELKKAPQKAPVPIRPSLPVPSLPLPEAPVPRVQKIASEGWEMQLPEGRGEEQPRQAPYPKEPRLAPLPTSHGRPTTPGEKGEPPPFQGSVSPYVYPQTPMQSQSLDWIIGRPHPQENPPGPRVHPLPGLEMTVPPPDVQQPPPSSP